MASCTDKSEPALVGAVAALASKSKVPQLWIYADNDELFPAALVNRMHEAALGAGADVRRVSLPKLEPRGHNVFGSVPGRRFWLREMDNSLRAWKLPTLKPEAVLEWSKVLNFSERERSTLERYLGDPGHKAMSLQRQGQAHLLALRRAERQRRQRRHAEGLRRQASGLPRRAGRTSGPQAVIGVSLGTAFR